MPKIYVRPQYSDQDGYQTGYGAGTKYTASGNNYGVRTDRLGLVRFSWVSIPKGSTINSAKLHMIFSVKNVNDAQSFSYRLFVDPWGNSLPLDTTANEWDRRAWAHNGSPIYTFNWVLGSSGEIVSMDAKPHMQLLVARPEWTMAGGVVTFAIGIDSTTAPDNQYLHRKDGGWPPVLEVDYTPPASDGKQSVVNLAENCNLTRTTSADGTPAFWPFGYNQWWGNFATPTFSYSATPAPPYGGNALKVTAGSASPYRSMVIIQAPLLDDGEWYNISCYVYVPSGSPNVFLGVMGDRAQSPDITEKNQWVRVDVSLIGCANDTGWAAVQQTGGTYSAGSIFYVANIQVTKGRICRPYIDGNRVISGADIGWGCQTYGSGFARSVPPTVAITPPTDKARRKHFGVNWTYSQASGIPQQGIEMKIRKVG